MQLNRQAVEWYALEITTDPTVTGWEASFDDGTTWLASTTVGTDGWFRWLVAGPDAPTPGSATVLAASLRPLVRAVENPEVVVRDAPRIYLT